MLVSKAVQLTVLAAAMLWVSRADAAPVKLCGRNLGEAMSRICHKYNSPSWDVPTVVEQPAAVVRRRRQTGIADECCTYGCNYDQLSEYCAISANSESLDFMESHLIEDRSAETGVSGGASGAAAAVAPAAVGSDALAGPREVGRARSRGTS
ncbi:insulin-like growth factor I isoform X3 [Battus philenor]|uniref:insulin-like growth factor I isoform X3 n=1 Tax=Battus philenor TaxID=42288 RepID=UPI0035D0DB97